MWESAFDADWESLSREEALFRAYALGVDAALGADHPAVVERLSREASRPLVQLAYDEGRSVGAEELPAARVDANDDSRPPSAIVWDRLVEEKRDDEAAFELVRVTDSRIDLPGALSAPGFLDGPSSDVDAIRLPRFLLR
ncbi:MAG: hypothetical protein ABEJ55_03585 [Halanaeroarchaeum sp.]